MAIYRPEQNDVLCGRGKFAMNWKGNTTFTALVKGSKATYFAVNLKGKKQISKNIIDQIHSLSSPGRFLKMCDNGWVELDYKQATQKVRQALREDARHFINGRLKEDRSRIIKKEQKSIRVTSSQQRNLAHTNSSLNSALSDNIVSPNYSAEQTVTRE